MTAPAEADAVERARAAAGLAPGIPGRAWHVRRLDRPDDSYWLVVLGEPEAAQAVATVHAATGEVGSFARVADGGPHFEVDVAAAREAAGADEHAPAELVWRPSFASRSPLYPLWEVETAEGRVYVDHAGAVLRGLD